MNIVLKMSILNIVVLVTLAAATGVTAEKHFVHATRNDSVSFTCTTTKTTGCELYKYKTSKTLIISRTHNGDKRFKIRDAEYCVVEIYNLKTYDSGEFHCITDKDYEVYYLDVKGKPSNLFYNNRLWRNNSENLIYPNEQGNVNFKCYSFLQKSANPRASFVWSQDEREIRRETPYNLKQNDDLWESESNVQIKFKLGEKEKEIKCSIQSGTETEILIGKFGIPYSTNEVFLEDTSAIKERTILEGDAKQITCKGNGFPSPKDILMKMKTEDEEWELVSFESTFTVADSGTYLCEARNEYENATKTYIASNKLSFRNYDRELAIMSQMLFDLNVTVAELREKVIGNNETAVD